MRGWFYQDRLEFKIWLLWWNQCRCWHYHNNLDICWDGNYNFLLFLSYVLYKIRILTGVNNNMNCGCFSIFELDSILKKMPSLQTYPTNKLTKLIIFHIISFKISVFSIIIYCGIIYGTASQNMLNINWYNGGWIIIMGRNHSGWINLRSEQSCSIIIFLFF